MLNLEERFAFSSLKGLYKEVLMINRGCDKMLREKGRKIVCTREVLRSYTEYTDYGLIDIFHTRLVL